jgi:hypothetical protein
VRTAIAHTERRERAAGGTTAGKLQEEWEQKLAKAKASAERRVKDVRKNVGVLKEALKTVADELFAIGEGPAGEVKKTLEAAGEGKSRKDAKLAKQLVDWLANERTCLMSEEMQKDRRSLEVSLEYCKKQYAKEGKEVVKLPIYQREYREALKLANRIEKSTTSILVKKEMEKFKERLGRQPNPESAKEKPKD